MLNIIDRSNDSSICSDTSISETNLFFDSEDEFLEREVDWEKSWEEYLCYCDSKNIPRPKYLTAVKSSVVTTKKVGLK